MPVCPVCDIVQDSGFCGECWKRTVPITRHDNRKKLSRGTKNKKKGKAK